MPMSLLFCGYGTAWKENGKPMYPSVKSVTPAEDYLLSIDFDNWERGILDMKPYLDFGIFERLKDRNAFN